MHYVIIDGKKKKAEFIPYPAGTKKADAVADIRNRWESMSPQQKGARDCFFLMSVGSKNGKPDYTGRVPWKMVEEIKILKK